MTGTFDSNGVTAVEGDDDPLLTARERAALTASAAGLGVAEVAEVLALPPAEVRCALASAIAKLGARSKLEAVVIALRTGLIALRHDPNGGDDPGAECLRRVL